MPKSTEIKIFFKVKYFYHNYSLFSNDLSNNQIEKIITKTSVQLFLRIGFFHKCIHLSYNHEIENLDFNLRQRMGAGIYFQTEHESKTCQPGIDSKVYSYSYMQFQNLYASNDIL